MNEKEWSYIWKQILYGKSILFVGKKGVGKTFLLKRIYAELHTIAQMITWIDAKDTENAISLALPGNVLLVDNAEKELEGKLMDAVKRGVQVIATTTKIDSESKYIGKNSDVIKICEPRTPDETIQACKMTIKEITKKYSEIIISEDEIKNIFYKCYILKGHLHQAAPGACIYGFQNILRTASMNKHQHVTNEDVIEGMFGMEYIRTNLKSEKTMMTAFHEAGHYIAMKELVEEMHSFPVAVRCIQQDGFSGCTSTYDEYQDSDLNEAKMMAEIVVDLAGETTTRMVFPIKRCGLHEDLKRATEIARMMCMEYSMGCSVLHPMSMSLKSDEMSQSMCEEIERKTQRILDECYDKAKEIITSHMNEILIIAELLIKNGICSSLEIDDACKKVQSK